MFSRALHHADAGAIPSGNSSNLYFMSAQRALEFEAELDELQETYSSGMGCVRGLRVAFAIEAVAVMTLFGLWYAWHLLR